MKHKRRPGGALVAASDAATRPGGWWDPARHLARCGALMAPPALPIQFSRFAGKHTGHSGVNTSELQTVKFLATIARCCVDNRPPHRVWAPINPCMPADKRKRARARITAPVRLSNDRATFRNNCAGSLLIVYPLQLQSIVDCLCWQGVINCLLFARLSAINCLLFTAQKCNQLLIIYCQNLRLIVDCLRNCLRLIVNYLLIKMQSIVDCLQLQNAINCLLFAPTKCDSLLITINN